MNAYRYGAGVHDLLVLKTSAVDGVTVIGSPARIPWTPDPKKPFAEQVRAERSTTNGQTNRKTDGQTGRKTHAHTHTHTHTHTQSKQVDASFSCPIPCRELAVSVLLPCSPGLKVARNDEPLVLLNTSVTLWPAMRKWNLDQLAAAHADLPLQRVKITPRRKTGTFT